MAAGLYQCTALQSRARPADRSGSHYRNGFGVVSLSQNLAEETQRVIHGSAPFHSASASPTGYAPAERNSVLSTLTSLGVGQIKPPKWARPTCQKHLETVGDCPSTCKYGQDGLLTGDFTGVICKQGFLVEAGHPASAATHRFPPSDYTSEPTRSAAQMPRETVLVCGGSDAQVPPAGPFCRSLRFQCLMQPTSAKADTARIPGIGWRLRSWLGFRRGRCFLTGCKHDGLVELAVHKQAGQELPLLLVQYVSTVNHNKAQARPHCESNLECHAKPKLL